jgi:pyruvate formate lyase activating enzyme
MPQTQLTEKLMALQFNVAGVQWTSLVDFPSRVSSVLFTPGCNLRCPFCYNTELLSSQSSRKVAYLLPQVFSQLKKRANFITGVVITGGEPTLQPDLVDFLCQLRQLDVAIKLDTNGLRPDVLYVILKRSLVDYVAMDLKTNLDRYDELGAELNAKVAWRQSLQLLKLSNITYEIRTTCAPGLVELADMQQMLKSVGKIPQWSLQQFQPQNTLAMTEAKPRTQEELLALQQLAETVAATVQLRGINFEKATSCST